ncbi:hypothetical protein QAD02_017958 [Eretmocerus hayati]|uniref:Uncharacterized protein n=1 Tax=Eretmocerus hayati TaxID=131215 RepID=A0ACC2PH72_9HYME|nr:hypothetical protein QAD02_017958 [Eretmocerus hayati]
MVLSLVLLLILAIQGSVIEALRRQKRVVNGDDVLPGEIPYQVSIQARESKYHHCGGTIIDEYHVLTAGHCVHEFNPEEFHVVSGTVDLNKPRHINNVSDFIVHNEYAEKYFMNDIALVQVSTPFIFDEYASPAVLPQEGEDVLINSTVLLSGFGRLRVQSEYSRTLKKANMKVWDMDYCKTEYESSHFLFTDSQICAFDLKHHGMCKGDSGGPLTNSNGKVIGVSSYTGDGCADSDTPSVFTKISGYIKWISSHICGEKLC